MQNKILYKYLDIDGGWAMLWSSDLQFTNATQLNDPFDCHPKLLDYSNIPKEIRGNIPEDWYREKEELDASNLRNDTWLCSLSKTNDSLLMWAHYCYNNKGICIGLDIEKVMACVPEMFGQIYLKPLILEVQYQDIIQRPDYSKSPWFYQLQTKAKDWEYEQEVRLAMIQPSPAYAAYTPEQIKQIKKGRKEFDWKEMRHYQPLTGDCFESLYFGINVDPKKKEKIIAHVRSKLNPDIKLYQMTIDPDAFRLKIEPI